jgi:hypothetical protein
MITDAQTMLIAFFVLAPFITSGIFGFGHEKIKGMLMKTGKYI